MNLFEQQRLTLTRRALFQQFGHGLGACALTGLLNGSSAGGENSVANSSTSILAKPHFAPKAKRVIFLHMVGGPSQLELFENKPALAKNDGQPVPKELIEGKRFAFLRGHPKLLGPRFKFSRHGQSGLELSELLPHLGSVADEIAMIKTLRTEEFNHGPAQLFVQTGFGRFGRPSIGSWVNYGLGSECENLPGFVVLNTGAMAGGGSSLWGSGFLPTMYQGIEFRGSGDPVLFLSNPQGINSQARREILDGVQQLNRIQLADVGDPEIATRISQYEMAFRMQTSVPELMDISGEPQHIHDLYGTSQSQVEKGGATPGKAQFAQQCLLARRLVERGVRFVQLYNADWDHHNGVSQRLPEKCKETDQAIAALIKDLKQRGLLNDTLIVWTSEFGRTPMLEGNGGPIAGRDHHKDAYCVWMAGGGIRAGITYGCTDELGYFGAEKPMHVHDLHATVLHLLGIDHLRLTFKFQGRQFRLTDVGGNVAHDLIA